ncbi:MAG TPA: TonB family protein [Candidatus Sulfopaludibacter sp.]|nr:TonB family protein [Candidatus Sulfopaludibacter sp.]
MNRLQKKCVIATAGVHLLLLVILIVGPAFFEPRPKADDLNVLDVIPANLIDAPYTSGVKNAQALPPVQPAPPPPAPQPVVTPPPKPVEPTPTLTERLEKIFKSEPPKPALEKVQPHKIEPNLKPVMRNVPRDASRPDNSAQRAQALRSAIRNLRQNLSPSTTVDMPGNSSVAYANYAAVVKSIYEQAWTPPDDTSSDDANTKVTVTVASDGTVVSARIITPSDDAQVDASVQRTLERVTFIAPFPEGAQEKERTYIINFNLKAKRMLG